MSQYCPHTSTCPFIRNLTLETRDKRVDVIIKERCLEEHFRYDCLALIAIDDEMPIAMSDALKSRLSNAGETVHECSHLTLLNLTNEARDFASYVMTRDVARDEERTGKRGG